MTDDKERTRSPNNDAQITDKYNTNCNFTEQCKINQWKVFI